MDGESKRRSDTRGGRGCCILEGKLQFTPKTQPIQNPCEQFTSLIGRDEP